MKAILVNYNHDPEWLKDANLDVTMYDRSDDGIERNLTQYGKVIRTPNRGDVDYDKLTFLIENYWDLPEVFVWGKTNLFKYVEKERFEKLALNSEFAPLLKHNHRIYSDQWGEVNRFDGNIYYERADSWFFNVNLDNSGHFRTWQDWALAFGLPVEDYIPFAPGGNYILTFERVHRYSRDFYEAMRDTLGYAAHPVEAHCCERSYYYLWR